MTTHQPDTTWSVSEAKSRLSEGPALCAAEWSSIHRQARTMRAHLKERKRSEKLLAWVASIRNTYETHILPMTTDIAETAAVLRAQASQKGRVLHIEDAIIAATAIEHGLTLVTRNVSDFEVTGGSQRNPWDEK